MGKINRAWRLTVQSGRVLASDKELLVFPILSTIALAFVLVSFAVPLAAMVDWTAIGQRTGSGRLDLQTRHYVMMFCWYFVNFAVMTFFNSGLVAAALERFEGRPATLGYGLRTAADRLPQILAWSAVAATVGVVLKAVQDRSGWLGQIVIGLIGMLWSIATFFVVPVLVVERVGPFEAVKRSVEILKKTWGESLVANLGLGAVTTIAVILAFAPAAGGIAAAVSMGVLWPALVGVPVTFVLVMLISLVATALSGVLLAATYSYAVTGVVPEGFDAETVRGAFRIKK